MTAIGYPPLQIGELADQPAQENQPRVRGRKDEAIICSGCWLPDQPRCCNPQPRPGGVLGAGQRTDRPDPRASSPQGVRTPPAYLPRSAVSWQEGRTFA